MVASINWDEIAEATEGFSGADLQALIYNAHLEVVHSSIATEPALKSKMTSEEQPVEYTAFGGSTANSVLSRAEDLAIQRRVSPPHSFPCRRAPQTLYPAVAPNSFGVASGAYQVILFSG